VLLLYFPNSVVRNGIRELIFEMVSESSDPENCRAAHQTSYMTVFTAVSDPKS